MCFTFEFVVPKSGVNSICLGHCLLVQKANFCYGTITISEIDLLYQAVLWYNCKFYIGI